jgi:hypothetical protein
VLLPGCLDTGRDIDRKQTGGDPVRQYLADGSECVNDRAMREPTIGMEGSDQVLDITPADVLDLCLTELYSSRFEYLDVTDPGDFADVVPGVEPTPCQLINVTLSRLTSVPRFLAALISFSPHRIRFLL